MEYIFMPESRLPEQVGFSLFGPGHMAVLGILALLTVAVVLWGCRLSPTGRDRLLKGMAGITIGLEIGKDVTLGIIGAFSIGYLPLHLCSMAMFICLYFAWHPDSDGGGQLLWGLCFSGGLAALLFPDWTNMPLWHFQSVHSFLYHGLLVQMSLIGVCSGMVKPRVRKVWKPLTFLAVCALVIYPLNLAMHTNYMFLNRPLSGTPLALCARIPGRWGYLLGYGALAAAVLVLLDLPFSIAARRKGAP